MKSLLSAVLLSAILLPVANATENREWSFRVLLDDKEVGSQYFRLQDVDGQIQLETEADLAVKMLFVTVYRYLHTSVETWDNGCLTSIESRTKVNGRKFSVSGKQEEGFFAVSGTDDSWRLPECVMSFAYWNPSFLQQSQLLNSQNGKYVDIEVTGPVADERTVRGQLLPAQRYRLVAGDIDMQIWYSFDNHWLALESKTGNGRTLTYDLM